MYITVRTFDGKLQQQIRDLSKLTRIEDLRERLVEHFSASVDRQRLFYRGKEMVDGETLFSYGVNMNDTVQLMLRKVVSVLKEAENKSLVGENDNSNKEVLEKEKTPAPECESPTEEQKDSSSIATASQPEENGEADTPALYKKGDIVDVRDPVMGAWFEGRVVSRKQGPPTDVADEQEDIKLLQAKSSRSDSSENSGYSLQEMSHDDGWVYEVKFEGEDADDTIQVSGRHVRPRSRKKVTIDQCKPGLQVMINYNYDDPSTRGYWYDAILENVPTERRNSRARLTFTVFLGPRLIPLSGCCPGKLEEMLLAESPGSQLNSGDNDGVELEASQLRVRKPDCEHCKDEPNRKCRECSCRVCGEKSDSAHTLLCDECDQPYHMACLSPPMTSLPAEDEDWYCPNCKNDTSKVVAPGQRPKESKKRSSMPAASATCTRDWGRGFACTGRKKVCNLVPSNHFGPVPGVEVGQAWLFRVQASEAGVHRPPVSGIHGRDVEGAYSIVLSGGYEDDLDNGNEFFYTGAGGRDLTGNKRTAEQSCDQLMTRTNRALARNCAVSKVNEVKGADAGDNWSQGLPVRVLRNYKAARHSKYAPEKGNRYDGIYKVVKYWPEKGKSGFLVWRYLLRRDDPVPEPWSVEGMARIAELGLEMEVPEGFQENQAEEKGAKGKQRAEKRKAADETVNSAPSKKIRVSQGLWKPSSKEQNLVDADTQNHDLWTQVLHSPAPTTRKAFLDTLQDTFCCLCCQELVYKPVTTPCAHNICLVCLSRSFKAEIVTCPYCRTDLSSLAVNKGAALSSQVNEQLQTILTHCFPGYETAR